MIEKKFDKSLELINEINNLQSCTASGISFMENRNVEIKKEKQNFLFTFNSPYQEYEDVNQSKHKHLEQFIICSENKNYIVPKGSLITKHKDLMFEQEQNEFSCTISSQCIYSENINLQSSYYFRCFIPLNDKISFNDFSAYYFQFLPNKSSELLKIIIAQQEYHFGYININDNSFLFIDSTTLCSFGKIDKITLSIIVAFGFLCGTIYLDEMCIVLSNNANFDDLQGIYYKDLRDTIKGQYTIFTTNAYSVLCHIGKISNSKQGEEQAIQRIKDENWTGKLEYFPEKVFSNLVQEIYNNDAVLRSAMIIVEASKFTIDIQLASYCVAFETLTKYIMKKYELKTPNPIDEKTWKTLRITLEKNLSNKDISLSNEQITILKNKINNLNKPTNKDTLMLPFKQLSYKLSDEEKECIDYRNLSLHGSLPVKDGEDEIDKLFYVNLMLHKLCSILILKLVGFEGYIINNLKLHEKNIKRTINEDGFIKI